MAVVYLWIEQWKGGGTSRFTAMLRRRWAALEIPTWMFDSSCEQMRLNEVPAVDCEVLRHLKLLLASASTRGHILAEAQGVEGGADAKAAKSKRISTGTVSAASQDPSLVVDVPGAAGKDDTVAVSDVSAALGTAQRPDLHKRPGMSEKVKSQHLDRKALLYVRQSSLYQVNHNLESQKLQYAMQERLHVLGWREIEVVDEDLGCSAAGTVTRSGFDRMVTEVCMGTVGAVAAREVSRFAQQPRVATAGRSVPHCGYPAG